MVIFTVCTDVSLLEKAYFFPSEELNSVQEIDAQVILLLIILYIIAIISNIVYTGFQQNMLDIPLIELIVTIFGVAVAIIGVAALFAVYFLDRRHKKEKACDALMLEINHNRLIFTNPRGYYEKIKRK
jgi:hypothetical protein